MRGCLLICEGWLLMGRIYTFDVFLPLLKTAEDLSERERDMRREMCGERDIDEKALEKLYFEVSKVSLDPIDRDKNNYELHSFSMEEWLERFDSSL